MNQRLDTIGMNSIALHARSVFEEYDRPIKTFFPNDLRI